MKKTCKRDTILVSFCSRFIEVVCICAVTSLVAQRLLVRSRYVALWFIVFVSVACPFKNMTHITHFSYYLFTLYTTRSYIHISTSSHASVCMQLYISSLYIRLSLYACHATFHCSPPRFNVSGRLAVQLCSSAPDARAESSPSHVPTLFCFMSKV